MLTGLACREVPDTLVSLIEKRIEREYGAAPKKVRAVREPVEADADVDEPVVPPAQVDEVAKKYPPKRLRAAAQPIASTPKGDPMKAKYNPENPEVLRMEE